MYYLFESDGRDGDVELYLVRSSLGAVLTTRLLLHVDQRDHQRVLGYVEEPRWFGVERSSKCVDLSYFVTPSAFTRDIDSRAWSLLHVADARALHRYWVGCAEYKKVPEEGKANYFKNMVDDFGHKMEMRVEEKWFK